MKNTTWLLIANASKARFYSFCKARFILSPKIQDLTPEEECEHAESRKKGTELAADKLGGFGNGTFVEATEPKHHEAEIFAKDLVEKLDSLRKEDQNYQFIIAAPPTFLGLLKKHLSQPLTKKVSFIERDYTAHEGKQLVEDLIGHL